MMLFFGSVMLNLSFAQISKSVSVSPAYNFYDASYGTYLFWNQSVFADSLNYFSDHVEFINASLGSSSNPSHSFGIGLENANGTIEAIAQDQVQVSLSRSLFGGNVSYLIYYFTDTAFTQLSVSLGGSTIASGNFYISNSSFDSSSSPAVLINSTKGYIKIKTSTAVLVTINYIPTSTSNSTTITSNTTNTASNTGKGSSSSFEEFLIVAIVLIVVALALVLLYYSKRKERKDRSRTHLFRWS
jgi:hypothetical protein